MTIAQECEQIGFEKGMKQGVKQGMQQGMQTGAWQEKHSIARKLLSEGMDITYIAHITGLSIEQVKRMLAELPM